MNTRLRIEGSGAKAEVDLLEVISAPDNQLKVVYDSDFIPEIGDKVQLAPYNGGIIGRVVKVHIADNLTKFIWLDDFTIHINFSKLPTDNV